MAAPKNPGELRAWRHQVRAYRQAAAKSFSRTQGWLRPVAAFVEAV